MEIFPVTDISDMSPEWLEVIGDRPLLYAMVADFGLADAVVCLMCFGCEEMQLDCTMTTVIEGYEVGHGESMRGYEKLYEGTSGEDATAAWLKEVATLGGIPEAPEHFKAAVDDLTSEFEVDIESRILEAIVKAPGVVITPEEGFDPEEGDPDASDPTADRNRWWLFHQIPHDDLIKSTEEYAATLKGL